MAVSSAFLLRGLTTVASIRELRKLGYGASKLLITADEGFSAKEVASSTSANKIRFRECPLLNGSN